MGDGKGPELLAPHDLPLLQSLAKQTQLSTFSLSSSPS